MKNTQQANMNLLLILWEATIGNLEKILAVTGGMVAIISLDRIVLNVDINTTLYGLFNACLFAAAGWFIKFLLDKLKRNGFRILKKRKK